jgi:hypothetical protein
MMAEGKMSGARMNPPCAIAVADVIKRQAETPASTSSTTGEQSKPGFITYTRAAVRHGAAHRQPPQLDTARSAHSRNSTRTAIRGSRPAEAASARGREI